MEGFSLASLPPRSGVWGEEFKQVFQKPSRAFEIRILPFMKVIIALDAGTTNVKAILVDPQANAGITFTPTVTHRIPTEYAMSAPTTWRRGGRRPLIKQALPDGGKIMVFVGTLDAQNARVLQWYQGSAQGF
jgi:hypothetical protein